MFAVDPESHTGEVLRAARKVQLKASEGSEVKGGQIFGVLQPGPCCVQSLGLGVINLAAMKSDFQSAL